MRRWVSDDVIAAIPLGAINFNDARKISSINMAGDDGVGLLITFSMRGVFLETRNDLGADLCGSAAAPRRDFCVGFLSWPHPRPDPCQAWAKSWSLDRKCGELFP